MRVLSRVCCYLPNSRSSPMNKHPATAGSLPSKGSGCGLRPDLDAISAETHFDFSAAAHLLTEHCAEHELELDTANMRPKPPETKR